MIRQIVLSAALVLTATAGVRADDGKLRHALCLYTDNTGVGMKQPESVACNGRTVVVADTGNDRLLRYSLEGGRVKTVEVIRAPELAAPVRVEADTKGDLYVLDARRRQVLRLGPQGEVKEYVDFKGVPAPATGMLRSFTIGPDSQLYLLDVSAERVLVLDVEGNYRKTVAFPEGYGFISDIVVDKKGSILAVDSVNAAIYTASPEAIRFEPLIRNLRDETRIAFPAAITLDAKERIVITDRNKAQLLTFQRDGHFLGRQFGAGWAEGLLRYPTQACINENGEAFLADWGNNRVQMFAPAREPGGK